MGFINSALIVTSDFLFGLCLTIEIRDLTTFYVTDILQKKNREQERIEGFCFLGKGTEYRACGVSTIKTNKTIPSHGSRTLARRNLIWTYQKLGTHTAVLLVGRTM